MLEVSDLSVSYGPIDAVRGASLSVGSGEAVALLGANGAGKTSTLHAISGLVESTGEIVFGGHPVRGRPANGIARSGLIHVPEGRHVIPSLTVHENLQVGLSARGDRRGAYDEDAVYELFPPLRSLRRRGGWALSGGEQQMVAIGRALVACPRMLMLDEPSLGLAPIIVDVVYSALAQIKDDVPLLVVEQNTARALELCSRAYVLRRGEVVIAGSAAELDDDRALMDAYLGIDPELEAR